MNNNIPLDDLIEALAGAVIDAQDQIEQHQLTNILHYFDGQNRPKSLTVRLPSLNPKADSGSEDIYRAPLLPLVSMNLLKIKDVEISFDVDLGRFSDESAETKNEKKNDDVINKKRKSIFVDMAGGRAKDKAGNIHIVLKVEGSEPSEGAARLINHLIQTQGVINTIQVD